jgi:hypothetical protein
MFLWMIATELAPSQKKFPKKTTLQQIEKKHQQDDHHAS